jgi:arginase family enzyme
LEEVYGSVLAMDIMEVSPRVEEFITPALAGKLVRQLIGLKEMKLSHPQWLEKV